MEYLGFALFGLFIIGETFFLQRKLNFPIHLAPLAVILFNTTGLYIFALAGALVIGFYISVGIGIILTVLAFTNLLKSRNLSNHYLPLYIFIVFLVAILIYTRGTLFYEWDEFSHWGVIFRYLMTVQALPKDLSSVIVSYPPFTALWQFFVSRIIGFKEENAYFAHILIQFSAVIAIFPYKKTTDWKKYLLVLSATILSIIALDFRFQALYVDLFMGLLLTVGVAQCKLDNSYTPANFVIMLLVTIALVLVKPIGILLALLVSLFGIVFLLYVKNRTALAPKWYNGLLKSLLDYRVLLLIVLPVIAWWSWGQNTSSFANNRILLQLKGEDIASSEIYPWVPSDYLLDLTRAENVQRNETLLYMKPSVTTIGIEDILRSFTINAPYRTKVIARNFMHTFSDDPFLVAKISLKIVFIAIFLLIAFNQALIKANSLKIGNRNLLINGLLLLGFVIYAIALYLSYIFIFYKGEGLGVPSLQRYLGTYLLAWWLVDLSTLYQISIEEISKRNHFYVQSFLSVLVVGLFLIIPAQLIFHLPTSPNPARFEVRKINTALEQVKFQPSDKIYEVYSEIKDDWGLRHYMMRYFLTPIGSNITGWQIGTPNGENDTTTVAISPQEWLNLLNSQGYTYVLVSYSDNHFWDRYKDLFDQYSQDPNRPQLFKVTADNLENVPLQY